MHCKVDGVEALTVINDFIVWHKEPTVHLNNEFVSESLLARPKKMTEFLFEFPKKMLNKVSLHLFRELIIEWVLFNNHIKVFEE